MFGYDERTNPKDVNREFWLHKFYVLISAIESLKEYCNYGVH